MFGFEKVLGRKPEQRATKEMTGGFSSAPVAENPLVFFEQPLSLGQAWKTKDGRYTLSVVEQRTNSGRFEIILKDRNEETTERQTRNSEEIKALLMSGGYELVSSVPASKQAHAQETAAPVMEKMPETALQEQEASEIPAQEKASLQARFEELDGQFAQKLEAVTGKLEELINLLNIERDRLGDEFYEFENMLRAREAAVNGLIEEDERLLVSVEGTDIQSDEMRHIVERQEKHIAALETYTKEIGEIQEKTEALLIARENVIPLKKEKLEPEVPEESVLAEHSVPEKDSSVADVSSADVRSEGAGSEEDSVETLIGKERYAALMEFVWTAWRMFKSDLWGKKVPKKIWEKIWQEQALPEIKKRVFEVLREQGIGAPEIQEAVYNALERTLPGKK